MTELVNRSIKRGGEEVLVVASGEPNVFRAKTLLERMNGLDHTPACLRRAKYRRNVLGQLHLSRLWKRPKEQPVVDLVLVCSNRSGQFDQARLEPIEDRVDLRHGRAFLESIEQHVVRRLGWIETGDIFLAQRDLFLQYRQERREIVRGAGISPGSEPLCLRLSDAAFELTGNASAQVVDAAHKT